MGPGPYILLEFVELSVFHLEGFGCAEDFALIYLKL